MSKKTKEPQPQADSRLAHFAQTEREAGVHPVVRALHSRPLARTETNRRAVEFARIERGHMA